MFPQIQIDIFEYLRTRQVYRDSSTACRIHRDAKQRRDDHRDLVRSNATRALVGASTEDAGARAEKEVIVASRMQVDNGNGVFRNEMWEDEEAEKKRNEELFGPEDFDDDLEGHKPTRSGRETSAMAAAPKAGSLALPKVSINSREVRSSLSKRLDGGVTRLDGGRKRSFSGMDRPNSTPQSSSPLETLSTTAQLESKTFGESMVDFEEGFIPIDLSGAHEQPSKRPRRSSNDLKAERARADAALEAAARRPYITYAAPSMVTPAPELLPRLGAGARTSSTLNNAFQFHTTTRSSKNHAQSTNIAFPKMATNNNPNHASTRAPSLGYIPAASGYTPGPPPPGYVLAPPHGYHPAPLPRFQPRPVSRLELLAPPSPWNEFKTWDNEQVPSSTRRSFPLVDEPVAPKMTAAPESRLGDLENTWASGSNTARQPVFPNPSSASTAQPALRAPPSTAYPTSTYRAAPAGLSLPQTPYGGSPYGNPFRPLPRTAVTASHPTPYAPLPQKTRTAMVSNTTLPNPDLLHTPARPQSQTPYSYHPPTPMVTAAPYNVKPTIEHDTGAPHPPLTTDRLPFKKGRA